MHEIKDDVLLLSSIVENAVMESVLALKENDSSRSRQVLQNDLTINRKRYEIETSIMVLIATQQPITHDLRTLAASLGVCTELERIGDYAKGIATINLRSGGLGMPAVVATFFFILYWIISFTGEKYTAEGVLPAWQGMWISSAVLLPLGIFLTYKATVDASLLDVDAWTRVFQKLFRIHPEPSS